MGPSYTNSVIERWSTARLDTKTILQINHKYTPTSYHIPTTQGRRYWGCVGGVTPPPPPQKKKKHPGYDHAIVQQFHSTKIYFKQPISQLQA